MSDQLALPMATRRPERFAPEVSHLSAEYVAGFSAAFVSARDADEPVGRTRAFMAGWLDSRVSIRVPEWRWQLHDPAVV